MTNYPYSVRSAAPLAFYEIPPCYVNCMTGDRSPGSRLGSKGRLFHKYGADHETMTLQCLRKNVEGSKHVRGASGAFALQSSCSAPRRVPRKDPTLVAQFMSWKGRTNCRGYLINGATF